MPKPLSPVFIGGVPLWSISGTRWLPAIASWPLAEFITPLRHSGHPHEKEYQWNSDKQQ